MGTLLPQPSCHRCGFFFLCHHPGFLLLYYSLCSSLFLFGSSLFIVICLLPVTITAHTRLEAFHYSFFFGNHTIRIVASRPARTSPPFTCAHVLARHQPLRPSSVHVSHMSPSNGFLSSHTKIRAF